MHPHLGREGITMQRRSSGSMVASGWSADLSVTVGILGSTVILRSSAAGQLAGWWVSLGFTLFFLWQFRATRGSRGPAGEPELRRVILSTEQLFTRGRTHS